MTRSRDQTFVTISTSDADTYEGKQIYLLHRELLCSHSPYFAGAFKGGFRESEDKSIHLQDVSASTMRLFQFWLLKQSTIWLADYIVDDDDDSNKVATDEQGRSLGIL